MKLIIDPQTNERIYPLTCETCGEHTEGNEVRFPENHGRESDDALEKELDATYTHRCAQHGEMVL